MTTIKSVFEYSPQTLLVETGKHEGETYLRINNGKSPMGDAMVATADLLAALDAVANADAEAKLLEQYRRADKAEAEAARLKDAFDDRVKSLQAAWDELGDLRAERDALAATVERVREATAIWGEGFRAAVLAALDPKPAFVLPTEVPARIEAKRDFHGYIDTLTLWTDGSSQFWRSQYNGEDWKPKGVMECFTDHRLLDNNGTGPITAEDLEGLDSADVRGAQ